MSKVGIGISSYNRPAALDACLRSIRTFGPGVEIAVVDDCSRTKLDDICDFFDAEFIPSPARLGIARNKNRIFERFAGYDYVFILEDDSYVKREDWAAEHIRAHELSGFHHFGHFIEGAAGAKLPLVFGVAPLVGLRMDTGEVLLPASGDSVQILLTEHSNGSIAFFPRHCIETVGGYDERFGIYGWEHMELTERIMAAGLCGNVKLQERAGGRYLWGHPALANINELVGMQNVGSSLPEEERKEAAAENMKIWERIKEGR